jgi:hypothetical protein
MFNQKGGGGSSYVLVKGIYANLLTAMEEYFCLAWNLIYLSSNRIFVRGSFFVTMFRSPLFSAHRCHHVEVIRIYGESFSPPLTVSLCCVQP